MDRRHRNNLRRCRQKIVEDLDVRDIVDKLIEAGVIDEECHEKIEAEVTVKARARRLLDTLPTRGPRAYGVFLEGLRESYGWLAEELENCGEGRRERGGTKEVFAQLQELLMKGGVPLPPSQYIARNDELSWIKTALCNLQQHSFLAIHGMPGSGKSVLAAHSVRDPEITLNHFPGGVFWFKVGMVDSDQLLNRLRALCMKLDASVLPSSIEEAQEILRKLFLSEPLCDSLVILDDVWKPEVIKTFQLPCRVLVTTQDTTVMEVVNGQYSVIEVQPGFREEETLKLFSSYLNVPVDFLPKEATAIHQECKGSPMVISMIAGLISESATQRHSGSGRWTHYLSSLKARRYSKLKKQHSYEHDSVMGAVQMSVDHLSPSDRKKYSDLAVFLDDVPIPTAVLEVLWGVDRYEVEDTMARLIKKSLAVSEYDPTTDSYIYNVHDLQLDYLKNLLRDDPTSEKDLHRSLVEQYLNSVNYQYGNLPNDNYIFLYLGYHLTMAGMESLFPDIYLDLGYVEAMLKAVGPVDLLNDYRKYGHIIAGEEDQHDEALADFEEFARTVGVAVSSRTDADIIQLALREMDSSAVYVAARRLADQRPETLYLEWSNRSSVQSQNVATILHPHPGLPHTLKFLPEASRVVTGSSEGVIKVWDLVSGEVLQRLPGHKAGVTCLSLDRKEDRFCSGSEDGTIKIWNTAPLEEPGLNLNGNHDMSTIVRKKSLKRVSPGSRQHKMQTLTEIFMEKDESALTVVVGGHEDDAVLAVDWRPLRDEVAVGGRSGTVWIYKLKDGDARLRLTGHREPVNCLRYNEAGSILATGSDDCTVRLWEAEGGGFVASLNLHSVRVFDLSWLGEDNRLATLSADKLLIWEQPGVGLDITELTRNRGSSWTCLAACSKVVAAGTAEDRMVIVWCATSAKVVAALPGHASPATSLDFSTDGLLLSSSSDETLMVWSVEGVDENDLVLSLGPPHHTRWRGSTPVTAAPDDMNRITVLEAGGVHRQSDVESAHVTTLKLSQDCSHVVYGTQAGTVKTYSIFSSFVQLVGSHKGTVTSVAVTRDNSRVVSGGVDCTVRVFSKKGVDIVCSGHLQAVRDVRIFEDDTKVLSCSLNGMLKVWNILTGSLLLDISSSCTSHATCLDVVDGQYGALAAVSGVGGVVRVVDLSSGACLAEVGQGSGMQSIPEPQSGAVCPVRVAKFSPDGRILVTGHDSGNVQIWESMTGLPLSTPLPLHSSWVTDVAVSVDGSTLLTAGDRLVWWRLETPSASPATPIRIRKHSMPSLLTRSRRSSGSRSNRASATDESLYPPSPSTPSSSLTSPVGTPPRPFPLIRPTSVPLISSPIAKRKIAKVGGDGKRDLLQTFDIKGSSVSKVFVNQDFSQFVTLDDAGILYILDELLPTMANIR